MKRVLIFIVMKINRSFKEYIFICFTKAVLNLFDERIIFHAIEDGTEVEILEERRGFSNT